jgi:type I restriction enzyme S subunit
MKPGYKLTAAGLIPEDWDIESLGNTTVITTGRKDVNEGNPLGEYPFYTCSRVHTFSDSYSFNTEAILIAGNGEVGNLHYHKGKFEAYQRTYVVHKFTLPARYIWHQLDYRLAASLGLGKIGTSIPYIKKENLTELYFPTPKNEPEQQAIVATLSDMDGLLEGLNRLIEKKRSIKQATMQQLLTGKFRLPGFSGRWETKQVASFTNCVAGGTPSTLVRSYWGGSIKWMSSGDLHLKKVKDVTGRITQAGLDNSAATVLPRQCILIGLAGQGKTRGTVAINLTELSTNQSIGAILPSDIFVPDYLFHNLDSRYTELRELSSGGGRGGLNLKLLGGLGIPLPSIPEQTAIACVLSDMDAEISALEACRDKTRALKQGMMQELLTGKTRLI